MGVRRRRECRRLAGYVCPSARGRHRRQPGHRPRTDGNRRRTRRRQSPLRVDRERCNRAGAAVAARRNRRIGEAQRPVGRQIAATRKPRPRADRARGRNRVRDPVARQRRGLAGDARPRHRCSRHPGQARPVPDKLGRAVRLADNVVPKPVPVRQKQQVAFGRLSIQVRAVAVVKRRVRLVREQLAVEVIRRDARTRQPPPQQKPIEDAHVTTPPSMIAATSTTMAVSGIQLGDGLPPLVRLIAWIS